MFKLILKAELYEMKCLGLLLGEIVVCRNVLSELEILFQMCCFEVEFCGDLTDYYGLYIT
jgi:hypothetical protein